MVNASMRQSGLTTKYQALVATDPLYAESASRLAWYLSLKIRHPHLKKPLLHLCLADAVLAAGERRQASVEEGIDRFIETLADRMTLLLRYRITRGEETWDPLQGRPLMEWFSAGPYQIESNSTDVSGMVPINSYVATMRQRLRGNTQPVVAHRREAQG